jgi:predicted phage tail component-like protein
MSNNILVYGTLEDFSFDGVDVSTKDFNCISFLKGVMPPQKIESYSPPKWPGHIFVDKKFEPRPIRIRGYIEADNHTVLLTAVEDLGEFLYSDIDKQLILGNQVDRYYNAQYIDHQYIELKRDYALLEIEFSCQDPFAYAVTPDTDNQTITVNDSDYVVNNGGSYYSFPVITVTFNQAQTHIYIRNNNITGNRLDISRTFGSGKELEIDCKNRIVEYDGSVSYLGFGDGGDDSAEWLKLARGNNQLFVGTDDGSIDIDVDLEWNKVYFY